MDIQKRYRRVLLGVLAVSVALLAGLLYVEKKGNDIPDEISVFAGETLSEGYDVLTEGAEPAFENREPGSYQVDYKLFGLLPLKTVSVDVVQRQVVIPCGEPAGIYVETDGVLVIDTGEITGKDGLQKNPAGAIIRKGDYITSVNGEKIGRKADLIEAVAQSGGKELILGIRRNGEEFQVRVFPAEVSPGEYKLGIWIRDNTQGIGIVTYVTPDGRFGALGHGISDTDTESLLETSRGLLYDTNILSVIKGQEGDPGELVGYIDYHASHVRGRIDDNTSEGIFGAANETMMQEVSAQPMQICLKQDIQTGPATILTSIDGEVAEYNVEIESVNLSDKDENKGMIIRVTDEKLLEKTGGIVQGMSGSPIMQNGKVVGAVTHVFVKDSAKGFGIFIENMLKSDRKGC